MACANTGIEKLSVILISVIPFSATLVTANPLLGTETDGLGFIETG